MKSPIIKQQGFTLIEIIVVVVIIGILATFIAPKFMGKTDTARITKAKSDILSLESALDIYKLDNFTYPTTDQGLDALVNPPTAEPVPGNWQQGGYIKKLQKDPWQREYQYSNDDGLKIYSLGADGIEGGEGANADISNLD